MRTLKLTCGAVLVVAAAACGGGDSANVMAAQGNALSPAQVDLALGPEVANAAANELDPGSAGDATPAPVTNGATETPQQSEAENRTAEPPEDDGAQASDEGNNSADE